MKPAEGQLGKCVDYFVEYNDKNPIFKFGDHVRVSKYKFFCVVLHSKLACRRFCGQKSEKCRTVDICY